MEALKEKYPVSDWQYEVANGDTVLGYKEWLLHCKEADEADQRSERGYECTVSCAYSAKDPCAAAREFLADLGRPNAPWCISVRNLDNDQVRAVGAFHHYMVSLPSGNVEESDEAWPGKHEGISAMAGDNYSRVVLAPFVLTSGRHKDIAAIAVELIDREERPDYISKLLQTGYGYSVKEIILALLEHLCELDKWEKGRTR